MYEAIYFEKPIIVSSNSFLAEKVSQLGIGYDVDALNENAVVALIEAIDRNGIIEKRENLRRIDKQSCVNSNDQFFSLLEERLANL